LLDQSGSMTLEGNRWIRWTTALKAFIPKPDFEWAGRRAAVFSARCRHDRRSAICLPANYVTPAVPLGPLPTKPWPWSRRLTRIFSRPRRVTTPPMGHADAAAVEGALQYLAGEATKHPERRPFLLLATDGLPSKLCTGNNIAGIGMALAGAAAGTPAIQTFVIGIGSSRL